MDYAGHSYGYGYSHGYSGAYAGGPSAYQGARRTMVGPTSIGLPYLPSLQRCVATLERSTQSLKSTVAQLDEATAGYPRLRTITSHTKRFALVSEQDIANAQAEVASDILPQLADLTDNAAQGVYDLESTEYALMEKVHIEEEKAKQRIQRQKTARSGLSNIKRLQSLTKRKEELSRSASELDEVLDQKRKEINDLINRVSSIDSKSGQPRPAKRLRRNPTNESRELGLKEEECRREIVKRDKDLEILRRKIEEKRRAVEEIRLKTDAQHSNSANQEWFNPSIPWTMYSEHYSMLEKALQTELKVDSWDKAAYEDAFGRLASSYLREIESRQAKTDKELSKLTRDKTRRLAQMRILCKQLFPEDSIGQTMVRVLELLGESPQSEIYHKDLVQDEFPPEEERRHNLGRVITILKQFGVLELVLESREEQANDDGREGQSEEPVRTEEQLVLRIKFEDNTIAV
ncbi:hypothetical protein EDD11_006971 [Mortierella claussenii]|nr:hypothetical protein EDD11_006971 [Mortierella claussenii]